MWPWRRKEASAPLPVTRAEWRGVPPIQRVVGAHPLVNPVQRFSSSLASWQSPAYLEPLGHSVGIGEPSGVIAGMATPRVVDRPRPEMPVLQRSLRRRVSTVDFPVEPELVLPVVAEPEVAVPLTTAPSVTPADAAPIRTVVAQRTREWQSRLEPAAPLTSPLPTTASTAPAPLEPLQSSGGELAVVAPSRRLGLGAPRVPSSPEVAQRSAEPSASIEAATPSAALDEAPTEPESAPLPDEVETSVLPEPGFPAQLPVSRFEDRPAPTVSQAEAPLTGEAPAPRPQEAPAVTPAASPAPVKASLP